MSKTKAHTRYRVKDGTIVPGTTTIIGSQLGWNKNVLIGWTREMALQGNDPNKIKDESAEIGTLAHYLVECWLKDQEADIKDYTPNQLEQATQSFEQFQSWWKKEKFELSASEIQVVSEKLRYGGTIDIIAHRNNENFLVDIKTSNAVYPEHIIQLAAYRHAYIESQKKHIDQCHIIQLSKTGGDFHHRKVSDKTIQKAFQVFGHLRAIYDLRNQIK